MTTDRIPYRHEAATPLTVAALRAALADAPDDSTVLLLLCDEPWSGRASGHLARSVEVRPAPVRGAGAGVVLTGGPGSGTLLRPRPGSLVVEHGSLDEDTAARLRDVVDEAVTATGYRGPRSVASPGAVTTWEWQSTDGTAVAHVVAAAETAAATVDPGTWTVRSQVGQPS